ncbi:hypothetical protein H696_00015 [Fonticula alba]|uniref:Uncharacterized protein n=1 Tax=Fonticula alba TaxID=691883 RepID=A0A058ZDF7_FONAL|nr:hypothetical protein H696_00015 [Fonticula alba]KCV72429.1 hypothetical protein H696_00015 [Fonticula alba]|eukprot:XP_009492130.1 hypothetical protein H696_00015 [Fonticula alba]
MTTPASEWAAHIPDEERYFMSDRALAASDRKREISARNEGHPVRLAAKPLALALAAGPAGALFLGLADCTIVRLDLTTMRLDDPASALVGHTGPVTGLAHFVLRAPDGTAARAGPLLASASWDRTVRLWDPATGECLAQLGTALQSIAAPAAAAAAPRPGLVLPGGHTEFVKAVCVTDLPAGALGALLPAGASPTVIWSSGTDGALRAWALVPGPEGRIQAAREVLQVRFGRGSLEGLAFDAANGILSVGTSLGQVHRFSLAPNEGGSFVGVVADADGVARVADGPAHATASAQRFETNVTHLAMLSLADGTSVECAVSAQKLACLAPLDPQDPNPPVILDHTILARSSHSLRCIAAGHGSATGGHGALLAAVGSECGRIFLWDRQDPKRPVLQIQAHGDAVSGLVFPFPGPEGAPLTSELISIGLDATVRFWRPEGSLPLPRGRESLVDRAAKLYADPEADKAQAMKQKYDELFDELFATSDEEEQEQDQ